MKRVNKKKEVQKVTTNDVLDVLSIKLNDTLKTTKKNRDPRDNSYYWLFKLIILMIYLFLLHLLFDAVANLGVIAIYAIGKSLRSILSVGWLTIIGFIKGIVMLYTVYNNVDVFMKSEYYEKLYQKDRKMCKKKKELFSGIKVFLQVLSIMFLLVAGLLAAAVLFVTVLFFKLLLDGVYIVSPIVICLSAFAICYLTFKHIQNKFFDTKPAISNTCFIIAVFALVIGVIFFGYETSGYEYKNTLPLGFETIKQEQTFDVSKVNKVYLKSNTKLNNIKIYTDNNLLDEIKVEVEYFGTTNVSYTYLFNENNNLYLTFSSELNFKLEDLYDVARLASASFNNSTIYNYNLFKYPNITIRANEKVLKKLTAEHE